MMLIHNVLFNEDCENQKGSSVADDYHKERNASYIDTACP
jgi:hypothetical protein